MAQPLAPQFSSNQAVICVCRWPSSPGGTAILMRTGKRCSAVVIISRGFPATTMFLFRPERRSHTHPAASSRLEMLRQGHVQHAADAGDVDRDLEAERHEIGVFNELLGCDPDEAYEIGSTRQIRRQDRRGGTGKVVLSFAYTGSQPTCSDASS
jgi:hypothetical protein